MAGGVMACTQPETPPHWLGGRLNTASGSNFRSPSYFRDIGGGGKPQKIRLHFSRNVRAYVLEREWHATEKVKSLPDGGLERS